MVQHLPSKCEVWIQTPLLQKNMGNGDHIEQTHMGPEPTVLPLSGTQWLTYRISTVLHCRLSSELKYGMPIGVSEFIWLWQCQKKTEQFWILNWLWMRVWHLFKLACVIESHFFMEVGKIVCAKVPKWNFLVLWVPFTPFHKVSNDGLHLHRHSGL
jgi:hypothetical protein